MVIQKLFGLEGKVALLTGGYSDIGTAIARGLIDVGAKVAITGRNGEKAEACADALRKAGGDAYAGQFDAMSVADTRRMVDDVAKHYGRIDILLNLVADWREEKAEQVTEENFDYAYRAILKTAMFQSQAVARHMLAQGTGGKLVLFGSVRSQLGLRGRGFSAYCATKGGLPILCKQLAAEWAPSRINVNVLAPTFTRTAQVAKWLSDPAFHQALVSRIPLGRVAETDDIVGAALFFASPASDFITGQTLYIDGGVTATQ